MQPSFDVGDAGRMRSHLRLHMTDPVLVRPNDRLDFPLQLSHREHLDANRHPCRDDTQHNQSVVLGAVTHGVLLG